MNEPLRKRRTREHTIADLSVNHIERQALLCGYTLERFHYDYGLDLRMFTYNHDGEIDNGNVLFQAKASDRVKVRPGQKTVSFRIDRRDLIHWLAQLSPVILILYDAKRDIAYWLYVQSYFRRQPGFNLFVAGKSVTVKIPVANVVDGDAIRKLGRFRDRVLAQEIEVIHEEEE
jgi:Domain of unknown function (DUF4365)